MVNGGTIWFQCSLLKNVEIILEKQAIALIFNNPKFFKNFQVCAQAWTLCILYQNIIQNVKSKTKDKNWRDEFSKPQFENSYLQFILFLRFPVFNFILVYNIYVK